MGGIGGCVTVPVVGPRVARLLLRHRRLIPPHPRANSQRSNWSFGMSRDRANSQGPSWASFGMSREPPSGTSSSGISSSEEERPIVRMTALSPLGRLFSSRGGIGYLGRSSERTNSSISSDFDEDFESDSSSEGEKNGK